MKRQSAVRIVHICEAIENMAFFLVGLDVRPPSAAALQPPATSGPRRHAMAASSGLRHSAIVRVTE